MKTITAKPLTRKTFAPFGDVIDKGGAEKFTINNGTTLRHHGLARAEAGGRDGHVLINIFTGMPFAPPVKIKMMERHPLGSQAFIPMQPRPFLIVVAKDTEGRPGEAEAFLAQAGQGINYHANVWHHPLIALEAESDFAVIDRGGDGNNLEEFFYDKAFEVVF